MIRTQIQLTEQQSQSLKNLAEKEGKSIAELIRQGIDQFLKAHQGIPVDVKKQRALDVAGKFRSGVSDISLHHDQYLAEAFEQ